MKTTTLYPSDFRKNEGTGKSLFYDLPGVTDMTESVEVEILSIEEAAPSEGDGLSDEEKDDALLSYVG